MWWTNALRITIGVLGLAGGASLAADEAAAEQQLSISDGRPVAKAVEILSKRHGIVITYEDPRYAFAGDLQDVTAAVSRSPVKPGHRVLVPRGGAMQLSYTLSPSSGKLAGLDAVVRKVLDANVASGGGSQFEVIQQDDVLHVVPVMVKNSEGVWIETRSILDTPITLPMESRSGIQMVDAICKTLSATAKISVALGMVPSNALANYQVVEGGTNEPARDILSRSLKQLSKGMASRLGESYERQYVWQLLFDPGLKTYALNLSFLPQAEVATQRPKEERPDPAAQDPDTARPQ